MVSWSSAEYEISLDIGRKAMRIAGGSETIRAGFERRAERRRLERAGEPSRVQRAMSGKERRAIDAMQNSAEGLERPSVAVVARKQYEPARASRSRFEPPPGSP
jgi:hypothetical protein